MEISGDTVVLGLCIVLILILMSAQFDSDVFT